MKGGIILSNSVDEETMEKIKKRANELCKEILARNQYDISERNQKIIVTLMKEFGITEDLAMECFIHNNVN